MGTKKSKAKGAQLELSTAKKVKVSAYTRKQGRLPPRGEKGRWRKRK